MSNEMKTSFYIINDEEYSPTWYKSFYDSNTYLNEHVDDDAGLRVKIEGSYIQPFRDKAGSTVVSFPDELANFNSYAIEAAMCCWIQDRQANDNNCGCADNTYAANCQNKNPGDNTDVCKPNQSSVDTSSCRFVGVLPTFCSQTIVTITKINTGYVDLELALHSHEMRGGLGLFDKRSVSGREGASHCHGFAWSANSNDDISCFNCNNL